MQHLSPPFTLAPLSTAEGFDQLPEQTRSSLLPSTWTTAFAPATGAPDVYICEAFGAADPQAVLGLCLQLNQTGAGVIVVWTPDVSRFSAPRDANMVAFDLVGDGPYGSYFFSAAEAGPHLLSQWMPFEDRPILASFAGARETHPVRASMFTEEMQRPDFSIEAIDWWGTFYHDDGHEKRVALRRSYLDVLCRSKYALCPRGYGPSSIRRWEAAYCGAIPVLMDDATHPFDVDIPSLRLFCSGESSHEFAARVVQAIEESTLQGPQMQERLRAELAASFDNPRLCDNHTYVQPVLREAARRWRPGLGFRSPAVPDHDLPTRISPNSARDPSVI